MNTITLMFDTARTAALEMVIIIMGSWAAYEGWQSVKRAWRNRHAGGE